MPTKSQTAKPRAREATRAWSTAEIVVILAAVLAAALIGIAQTGRLPL